MSSKVKSSLFDDIFQLQSTVPDVDPEDPEDGFKPALTKGANEVEVFGSTQLKKQAVAILDDPKYRGKKTSRKALYSDDEEDGSHLSQFDEDGSKDASSNEDDEDDDDDDIEDEEEDDSDVDENDNIEDVDDEEVVEDKDGNKKDTVVLTPNDSNDREKGKAVSFQLGLWDDLIKCRISLQKMVTSCNCLPTPDLWTRFASFSTFQKESLDAHSSIRQVLTSLLELQQLIDQKLPKKEAESKQDGMDEEITSESEVEDDEKEMDKTTSSKQRDVNKEHVKEDDVDDEGDGDDEDIDDKNEEEEDEMECDEEESDEEVSTKSLTKDKKGNLKRKLNANEAEEMLAKRHKDFQPFRNSTLVKWDEKTRLSHVKIKSKNFAAFDISVLKQIQQVLANKGRLIRRIHQNRSSVRTLGHVVAEEEKMSTELVLEDDEDEVEVRQRKIQPDMDINFEIVDDSDFYQMCLRDFIQLKQNEETDPVLANKHWLEIQNMRKKQKRKVDTRASKGRKIRYHVKEKLKNFMAPYDKSTWSDEQKDDLFKALFGGRQEVSNGESTFKENGEALTINIGL